MLLLNKNIRILAIGAHPDDIELSCAGTILKLKKEYRAKIYSIICSKGELKNKPNVRIKEQLDSNKYLKVSKSLFFDCRDGFILPNANLIARIEEVVKKYNPDLIFTHWPNDIHQDHRNVGWATLSATRRSKSAIVFYPSLFTRDQFLPNLFSDITKYFEQKLSVLSLFESQSQNEYMFPEVVKTRAKEAGLYCDCELAEQFYLNFGRF